MTLKAIREARLPKIDQLPPAIKGKVYWIEELHDRAMTFMSLRKAMEEETEGLPDFDAYVRTLPGITQKIEQEILASLPEEEVSAGEPFTKERLMLMRNPEYEPALELSGLLMELSALWYFWVAWPYSRKWEGIESDDEQALDLNLCKVAFRVGIETANIRHWGKKKEAAARLNLKKKIQVEAKKGAIFAAFGNVRKDPGDTLNRIVDRIFKNLKKGGTSKVGKTTIERAIKDNLQLMNDCFREEIRGTVKRFIFVTRLSDEQILNEQ